MKYKIAIGNSISFDVAGKFSEPNGVTKSFKFSLTCDRLDQPTVEQRTKDSGDNVIEFLKSIAKGWSGQKLVLDPDTDEPAEFNEESFGALLSIAGMPIFILTMYLKALVVKEKN